MDERYVDLSYWQVALAALLIVVNAAISLLLRLDLHRRLLWAAARMSAQLLMIGLILQWVFAVSDWYWVVLIMAVMTLIAGVAAVRRSEYRFPGIWWASCLSVGSGAWLIAAVALLAIVQVEPWYRPQYAIPLLGMILGNGLNGISLGLDRFGRELETHRERVEAHLALGATRWEAARVPVQQAVRTGMIPILNAMAVAGVVSLPGMMTGQLLAGIEPVQAVKYQIVIMFLIASATAIGTVGVVLLSYRRLFNAAHQFREDLIRDLDKDTRAPRTELHAACSTRFCP